MQKWCDHGFIKTTVECSCALLSAQPSAGSALHSCAPVCMLIPLHRDVRSTSRDFLIPLDPILRKTLLILSKNQLLSFLPAEGQCIIFVWFEELLSKILEEESSQWSKLYSQMTLRGHEEHHAERSWRVTAGAMPQVPGQSPRAQVLGLSQTWAWSP